MYELKVTDIIWIISESFVVRKHVMIPTHERDRDMIGTIYNASGYSYCGIVLTRTIAVDKRTNQSLNRRIRRSQFPKIAKPVRSGLGFDAS